MKTYWHGNVEVVILEKQLYFKNDKYETVLKLDSGITVFYMWESDFIKNVDVRII